MRGSDGLFVATIRCRDADGDEVFALPVRMAVSNMQRRDTAFVFDLTDQASRFVDGRMNGVVTEAGPAEGFLSLRLALPDMEDLVVSGRWAGVPAARP